MEGINQNQTELQLEEVDVKETLYWVDLYNSLQKLKENPDFQKVILEGYFKEHAVRNVSLLANEQIKRSGHRPDVMEALIGISSLNDFFDTIKGMGGYTQREIDEIKNV